MKMIRNTIKRNIIKKQDKTEVEEQTQKEVDIEEEEYKYEKNVNKFFGYSEYEKSINIKIDKENFRSLRIYSNFENAKSGHIDFLNSDKEETEIRLSQEQIDKILNAIFDE